MSLLGILCTTGLLLLRSVPQGAAIEIDGVAMGQTPRLVTALDASFDHRVRLRKTGYAPCEFKVHFNGRDPIAREETLVLDSGILKVITDPAGAEITVNGVVRGRSPVTVNDIPKGMAAVKMKLAGYRDEVRELRFNAGEEQTLAVTLAAIPGTLTLRSVPSGARFYVNDEPKGQGPVVIPGLAPGTYQVRCELEGYGPVTRAVTLGNGKSPVEEFVLSSAMGSLEVKTSPPGAAVYVDGRLYGTTKSDIPEAEYSDVFTIPKLLAGEHTLTVRKEGYAEVVRHPLIKENKTSRHHKVRLTRVFVPDVEILTPTGPQRGILVRKTDEHITLEVRLGVERSYPMSDVREIRYLEK